MKQVRGLAPVARVGLWVTTHRLQDPSVCLLQTWKFVMGNSLTHFQLGKVVSRRPRVWVGISEGWRGCAGGGYTSVERT